MTHSFVLPLDIFHVHMNHEMNAFMKYISHITFPNKLTKKNKCVDENDEMKNAYHKIIHKLGLFFILFFHSSNFNITAKLAEPLFGLITKCDRPDTLRAVDTHSLQVSYVIRVPVSYKVDALVGIAA